MLIFQNIIRFILLALIQLVILNHVSLGPVVIYIYILFFLFLPTNMNKVWMILIAFAVGLFFDLFNNMMGFHAFACPIVALSRILFADKFLSSAESEVRETPSFHTTSFQRYAVFSFVLIAIFYIAFFLVEVFDGTHFWQTFFSLLLSVLATWLLGLAYQSLFLKPKEK